MDKANRLARRKHRVNTVVKKSATYPRLIINRSNSHMQAQIMDTDGKVLAFASSLKIKKGTKSEKAFAVGEEVAKSAIKAWLDKIVFDRNWYLYHGRVKQLAEGARAGWLEF